MSEYICSYVDCSNEYHHRCEECERDLCWAHAKDHRAMGHEVIEYP